MKQLNLQIRLRNRVVSFHQRFKALTNQKWSVVALLLLLSNFAIAQRTITGTM